MTRSTRRLLGLAVLLALGLPLLVDALIESDKEAIDRVLTEVIRAVEARDSGRVLQSIHPEFESSASLLRVSGKEPLEVRLERYFRQADSLEVNWELVELEIPGDSAIAVLDVFLWVTVEGRSHLLRLAVDCSLWRVPSDWQIHSLDRMELRTGL